jgi:hypothetical protein
MSRDITSNNTSSNTELVEEHQNLNFHNKFQRALISDLMINVQDRSIWIMLVDIESA